jgi:hypothetical protein
MNDYVLIILSMLGTYPLSHIFMKRGMSLDNKMTPTKHEDLGRFFYIPFLNVIIMFFYLVWNVIVFKR